MKRIFAVRMDPLLGIVYGEAVAYDNRIFGLNNQTYDNIRLAASAHIGKTH